MPAIIALICALPSFASAQAGFPDKPLWLSNTDPVSGQEITLSTVLYNGTKEKTDGMLTFLVDGIAISPQEISLSPQSSTVVSAKWIATAGGHTFSARFGSGTSSAIQQANSITVRVSEPPPPSELQRNVTRATEVAGQLASSSAPFVQQIAQAVFAQTEALRTGGAKKLEEFIEDPRESAVAGNSTHASTSAIKGFQSPATPSSERTDGSALHSVAQTAAVAAHFIFRSIYLFYLVFVPLLFVLLAWAYRRLRRPNR